ncbi:MAG: aconitate hydratase, partial [Staphylococcus epidermidis]|nr:aconitate hydratase [Staphylococcus epidermidis]
FLNWATKAFDNYNAVPPATGIVHQVNLEYLANVVHVRDVDGEKTAFPDTLVGTDSHTTMINGIGVLGWGVGGIEAEAGMLGQPSYFPIPEVIGVRLTHSLPQGSTATDLALRVTEELRKKGVVGKFVEFFGPGVQHLPLADRATIANMAPEYGATCGFFPVDEESLKYMKLTGRDEEHIELVKEYLQQNHMFFDVEKEDPEYTDVIDLDLSTVEASLSGPKRPQDLIFLSDMKKEFEKSVTAPAGNQGHGLDQSEFDKKAEINFNDGSKATMKTGDIAIAAITSCTNTSNPYVMLGAGLVAKKAVEKGLKVPEFVKTSLAPGSKVVTGYLRDSGLQQYLDDLGFNLVGYGCTTCIGNSGPLLIEIEKAVADEDLLVTSPQLVVAYALAGTVDIDLQNEPIGKGKDGKDVYLQDIWPSIQEVSDTVDKVVTPELFLEEYKNVYHNNEMWNEIDVTDEPLYDFDPNSTYIQNPTFFQGLSKEPGKIEPLKSLRVMGKFGDSVTTDHISPAGAIGKDTPAGKYLLDHDVAIRNFNSYGSAAMKYKEDGTGLVVLAGNDYGMGSSRDWAAKGTNLLGVKTVIAQSYERIHRSNLVMMGVLPLQFQQGESAEALGLDGKEEISVDINEDVQPHDLVNVTAKKENGEIINFKAIVRFDSLVELDYYRHGGILQMVLRNKLAQ